MALRLSEGLGRTLLRVPVLALVHGEFARFGLVEKMLHCGGPLGHRERELPFLSLVYAAEFEMPAPIFELGAILAAKRPNRNYMGSVNNLVAEFPKRHLEFAL